MPRYGRDYRERNLADRGGSRHWFGEGEGRGYDVRGGYRQGPDRYDREYGWESRDRSLPPWEMNRFRAEGPRERDYRGGYGAWGGPYDSDYGYRPLPRREYRSEGRWDRPYRKTEDPWYGMPMDPYGPFAEGPFGHARSGGFSPDRYFTGYGVGAPRGYTPF
jgi:hypothetical protein